MRFRALVRDGKIYWTVWLCWYSYFRLRCHCNQLPAPRHVFAYSLMCSRQGDGHWRTSITRLRGHNAAYTHNACHAGAGLLGLHFLIFNLNSFMYHPALVYTNWKDLSELGTHFSTFLEQHSTMAIPKYQDKRIDLATDAIRLIRILKGGYYSPVLCELFES